MWAVVMNVPRFYDWDQRTHRLWSFGWETGEDKDYLICVRAKVTTLAEAEEVRSPLCSNRLVAFFAFLAKRALLRLDQNPWRRLDGRY